MRRVVAPSRRAVRAQRAEERRDARRGRPLASRVRVAEWRYPVARVPRRDVRVPRDPENGAFSMYVCIIDVAAMADMTRIAISAFLLKQRNVWAL